MMDLLWRVVNETEIPITQMYPTHMCGRGEALLREGIFSFVAIDMVKVLNGLKREER